ncbi:hypothetical protein [Thalassobacillus sp. C254]|uniref:hypothetical protein n=1 Tax=Thalassobacillus sp. C254 TaxID=1225341 RepID=UPI0006D20658|nr:hypothetical protein [Thalassobacillus sp. C254]
MNNTDRNTQILLQLINGMMVNMNINNIMTTEDFETDGLKTAKEKVQQDIAHQKQKRDHYYAKKGGE